MVSIAALRRLDKLITTCGLSTRSAQLLDLAQPAIRINARLVEDRDLPLGASKLGGLPDLPLGVQWPGDKGRPLALMAQFGMSDVAPYDIESALPRTGMLYFFYDMVDTPWGYDPANKNGWKVIYSDVEPVSLVRTTLPLSAPEDYPLDVCEVVFKHEFTLPPHRRDEIKNLDLSDEEGDNYWKLVNEGVMHRLLGYPAEEQGDITWEAQLASNGVYLGGPIDEEDPRVRAMLMGAADWRLLFQMEDDNDHGGAWFGGAGGRLFFSIRKQDLAQRNFDNVWISFHWQ